ncbi:MAG: hypothetical protein CL912_28475 [Deltaproteobacteria bacterium]|nr:hypothetical protein [Deltaproteobacteria bacterium]
MSELSSQLLPRTDIGIQSSGPKSVDSGYISEDITNTPPLPSIITFTRAEPAPTGNQQERQELSSITERDLQRLMRGALWAPDEQVGRMRRRWSLCT